MCRLALHRRTKSWYPSANDTPSRAGRRPLPLPLPVPLALPVLLKLLVDWIALLLLLPEATALDGGPLRPPTVVSRSGGTSALQVRVAPDLTLRLHEADVQQHACLRLDTPIVLVECAGYDTFILDRAKRRVSTAIVDGQHRVAALSALVGTHGSLGTFFELRLTPPCV